MSSAQAGPVTPELVARHLSSARIGTYQRACGGDLAAAVALYRWNATVAAAFWEILGHGEVILRNAMHDQLVVQHHDHGRTGEWFDDPRHVLTPQAHTEIRIARGRAGTGAPAGKVVAELSLGFWRYLLAGRYAPTLWPALQHAFPHRPRRGNARRTLEAHVTDLHQLRNRIAHHEPLINAALVDQRRSLQFVLDCIDPRIRTWALDDDGRLTALLQNRP